MAATLLREAYDCIVFGSGRTANQVAAAIARAGRQTLHLLPATAPLPTWLHPRLSTIADIQLDQRWPLSGVCAVSATGKTLATVQTPGLAHQRSTLQSQPTMTAFTVPDGCHVTYETNRQIRLNGVLPPMVIEADAVIRVASDARSTPLTVIGGIYRDVTSEPGADRQAMLFATRRAGEIFWLVPRDGGLWSLGLIQPVAESSLAEESLADLLEEALVACPLLIQRLVTAELVGGLHFHAEPPRTNLDCLAVEAESSNHVSLPNYDQWLDPVFASGDWLAHELAQQFVAQLSGRRDVDDRIAEWQTVWPAVEQLTRERISPWYQLDASLPEALHDHAQRDWYQRLLLGQ